MQKFKFMPVLLLSLLVPAMVACGDDDDEDITGTGGVTGTYTLRSVNGDNVPAIEYEDEEWKDEILSGSIRLDSDETCLATISWRSTYKPLDEVDSGTETDACTYSVAGGTITFDFSGDVETATIGGGTITVNDDGEVWIFKK